VRARALGAHSPLHAGTAAARDRAQWPRRSCVSCLCGSAWHPTTDGSYHLRGVHLGRGFAQCERSSEVRCPAVEAAKGTVSETIRRFRTPPNEREGSARRDTRPHQDEPDRRRCAGSRRAGTSWRRAVMGTGEPLSATGKATDELISVGGLAKGRRRSPCHSRDESENDGCWPCWPDGPWFR